MLLTFLPKNGTFMRIFPLPRRLMARQQTLDLLIEVRILAGQHGSPSATRIQNSDIRYLNSFRPYRLTV